eukprot:6491950-Amphidinium_carterae.1
MDVQTEQEELLDSFFLDYTSGIEIFGLICVYVDDLAIGASSDVIHSFGSAMDKLYGTGKPKVLGIGNNEIVYLGMQVTLVKSATNESGTDLFRGGRDSPAEADSFSVAIEKKESRDTSGAWGILKSLCSYLYKHSEFGVSVVDGSASDTLLSYIDISFAPSGGRSQAGVLIQWGQSTVTWRSYRQTLTTLSTCESELIGVLDGLESAKCIQILLSEIANDIAPKLIELRCDNQASVSLCSVDAPLRTRHLSIRALHLTEALQQGSCTLGWIGTREQKADYLTKPATRAFQRACLCSLGMKQCSIGVGESSALQNS